MLTLVRTALQSMSVQEADIYLPLCLIKFTHALILSDSYCFSLIEFTHASINLYHLHVLNCICFSSSFAYYDDNDEFGQYGVRSGHKEGEVLS